MEIENYCWFFIIFFFRMLSNIKFALENKPEKMSIHYNGSEGQKSICGFFLVVLLFYVGFMVIIFSFICLIRQTIIFTYGHIEVARQKTDKFSN